MHLEVIMNWKEKYQEKIVSVEEAMSHVKDGDMIVPGDFCAEPVYLIDTMTKRAKELTGEGIYIAHGGSVGPEPHLETEVKDQIHFHPKVIARNDNVVSLNSALEVDLLGQVAAEMIGPRQFTGVGGFTDYWNILIGLFLFHAKEDVR